MPLVTPHGAMAPGRTLRVAELSHDVGLRFDVRSRYVERLWLPLLGPTPTLLLRFLVEAIEDGGPGKAIDKVTLGRPLGIGAGVGETSTLHRALRRLERFGLLRFDHRDSVRVSTTVPALQDRDVSRLPAPLRALPLQLIDEEQHGAGA